MKNILRKRVRNRPVLFRKGIFRLTLVLLLTFVLVVVLVALTLLSVVKTSRAGNALAAEKNITAETLASVDKHLGNVDGNLASVDKRLGNIDGDLAEVNRNIGKFSDIITTDGNKTRQTLTEENTRVIKANAEAETRTDLATIRNVESRLSDIEDKLKTPVPVSPPEPARAVTTTTTTTYESAPTMQTAEDTHVRKVWQDGPWTITVFEKGAVSKYYSEEQFTKGCIGLGSESGVRAKLFFKKNMISMPWTRDVEVIPGFPFNIHGAYRVVFYSDTTDFQIWTKDMPETQ